MTLGFKNLTFSSKFFLGAFVFFLCFLYFQKGCFFPSSVKTEASSLLSIKGKTMGTTYTVLCFSSFSKQKLTHRIKNKLDELNHVFSTYKKNSEVSLFNAHLSTKPFHVSPALFDLVQMSLDLSKQTRGAFDITLAPLIDHFGFGHKKKKLSQNDFKIASSLVDPLGYTNLILQKKNRMFIKKIKNLSINLSAIAKGYGVDQVCKELTLMGINNYFVEIGGEIKVRGKKKDHLWSVGIQSPKKEDKRPLQVVFLKDEAIATSGDYQNYFILDDKKYSHLIDPKTKKPVESLLSSVSVIAQTCALADGLATAFFVMGEKQAYRWAVRHHIKAFFVYRNNKKSFVYQVTPLMKQVLQRNPKAMEPKKTK